MEEPNVTELMIQYADAVRMIAEQRQEIDSLRRSLEYEKDTVDSLRLRILQLQDQIAGACV